MHDALEKCAKNMSQYKHILFPEPSNTIINQKPIKMWFDRELNDEQKKAVSNIVSGKLSFANFFRLLFYIILGSSFPSPFILFGPPGTEVFFNIFSLKITLFTQELEKQ
jgi:hypothetical protein